MRYSGYRGGGHVWITPSTTVSERPRPQPLTADRGEVMKDRGEMGRDPVWMIVIAWVFGRFARRL